MSYIQHPELQTKVDISQLATLLEPTTNEKFTSHRLLPVMYEKLRQLAASKIFRESGLLTLQPTALVHEAWIRMTASKSDWDSYGHFFGAAAESMRRILVDRSRRKAVMNRNLNNEATNSADDSQSPPDHILHIHEAVERLELEDPDAAEIVVLKFFSGFTNEEIASMLSQSVRAVERQWTFAKARLFQIIQNDLRHKSILT